MGLSRFCTQPDSFTTPVGVQVLEDPDVSMTAFFNEASMPIALTTPAPHVGGTDADTSNALHARDGIMYRLVIALCIFLSTLNNF